MKYIVILISISLLLGCSSERKTSEQPADSLNNVRDTISDSSLHEETEEQETERVAREKAIEDEKAFRELNTYNGTYTLQTESEGVEGVLELTYAEDRVFTFKLNLQALDICKGTVEGEIFMDRTQHGLYQRDNCILHFNFMGNWGDSGFVVEIEQPDKCTLMEGDCIFSGKYITGN